ncbi:zinc-finger homeodomain protein 14 [Manihot esculenta]|uniref:ZF-HD dimerization-type domain-containing protein n=1 Tax=Manihot esculenta TaxID=3983 RepID=A0A2C9U760_MANES|nr:zinc-finger homeodomain protein 14 [Manihot esculenta]OAY25378.1 hypothetical protein MANES_17G089800v8 [Manihot esculenta]
MDRGIYKECMRNHSAKPGTYTVDGCGEFCSHQITSAGDYCAACGCAKYWHRRITLEHLEAPADDTKQVSEEAKKPKLKKVQDQESRFGERKRRKSKFTQFQIEIMKSFAEDLGWTLKHKDRQVHITRFCSRIHVSRSAFKNWVNNNKNRYASATSSAKSATKLSPTLLKADLPN